MKNKKEILSSSKNVVENPTIYKGSWNKEFNNNNDIHLEIGTGRCNFIINKALKYKNINFIGVERIDTVLAQGVKKIEEYIPNLFVIFLIKKLVLYILIFLILGQRIDMLKEDLLIKGF